MLNRYTIKSRIEGSNSSGSAIKHGMGLSMLVLLYVAGRIGYDLLGTAGACVLVGGFLGIEAFLFRTTRPVS